MPLSAGTQLLHYKIAGLLGAGGMGEVYRARDSRLNRDVAIKILLARDLHLPGRRARFGTEARAASALNHPNIVTVYDIGEHEGEPYIISELIDGDALRAVMDRGPVPVKKLLDIAIQIADALAGAHTAGITHRDLKPENIMITREGRAKVLDFGLARFSSLGPDDATLAAQTEPGTVLGTAAYMSPEQARGETADYQSDQFSFGIILHEMATGRPAFRRASKTETMAAIIGDQAPALEAALPAPLRWIIERLLAKEPDERYASTKDLHRDLRTVREHLTEAGSSPNVVTKPITRKSPWLRWLSLAAAFVTLVILAFLAVKAVQPKASLEAYRLTPIALEAEQKWVPVWAPDGRSISYEINHLGIIQIAVRALGAASPAQITTANESCFNIGWSPDSNRVYYEMGGALWSVSATGGAPVMVAQAGWIFARIIS